MFRNVIIKLRKGYDLERPLIIEWIGVIGIHLFAFVSFIYNDFKSLTIWSVNLLDVTFEGRPLYFFEYSAQNIHQVPHRFIANIWAVLPWSIWNIPIWILQRFFGYNILESHFSMAWSKLFLVVSLAGVTFLAYKISDLIISDKKRSMWAAILTASSVFVFTSVYYAGQNSIVSILYSVLAFYLYLKGKNKGFIFWSAMSIAVKPFFIFAFIALLLYRQKNVLKIMRDILLVSSITVISRVVFLMAPSYTEALEYGPFSQILVRMLSVGAPTSVGIASIFISGLVIVYFWAYIIREDTKKINYIPIYLCVVPNLLLILFSDYEWYRPIVLIPFLPILLVSCRNWFRINIILELVFSSVGTWLLLFRNSWMYSPVFMQGSIVSAFLRRIRGETILTHQPIIPAQGAIGFTYFLAISLPALAAIFLAAGVLLIVVNSPLFRSKVKIEEVKCERWILWFRLFQGLPFILLPLIRYLLRI